MSLKAESWQKAEIAGPKKALLILKPEVVVAMLKRAKRPILVVGHLAVEEYSDNVKMIDYAIEMGVAVKMPVIATAQTIKNFIEKDFEPVICMHGMDICNRLVDLEWKGLDGKGPYDLALFLGLPYYMEFVMLAALKNFRKGLKTISLDRFYNPHASWSFPNISIKDWDENFRTIISKLEMS